MQTSLLQTRSFRYGAVGAVIGLASGFLAFIWHSYGSFGLEYIYLVASPIVVGALAFAIGREEDRILARKRELAQAKDRFTSLTHSVIVNPEWQIGLRDPHILTCWQVKNCESADCPAYGEHHIRCWLLAGTYCRGEVQGKYAQKLGDCSECEVYQHAVGVGPINEIAEDFNCLMWAVRDKEELLSAANRKLAQKYRELEDLQKKTQEMADTDAMTGLRNYRHFTKEIKKETARARRYGRPLSLLMMDVENFRRINDRFGHKKGDLVLRNLGALLADEARQSDYVARYAGEKFVILMPETYAEGAVAFGGRLQEKIFQVARESDIPERYLNVNMGVSDFPECAADTDSLQSAADSALLIARRQGDNHVAYFCDLSEATLKKEDLQKLNSRLEGAGLTTIQALAEAVDAADKYPRAQRESLVKIAGEMAERLGMEKEQADCLALAACLHDIGKIGVPAHVLQKSEKLSSQEMKLVREHPQIGRKLLEEAKQIENLVMAILYHHERWDGSGYPSGLKGEEIPIIARIVGVLDAYRAMTCDRPYRKALSMSEAVRELKRAAGTQFDPVLVELFVELIESQEHPGPADLRRVV